MDGGMATSPSVGGISLERSGKLAAKKINKPNGRLIIDQIGHQKKKRRKKRRQDTRQSGVGLRHNRPVMNGLTRLVEQRPENHGLCSRHFLGQSTLR